MSIIDKLLDQHRHLVDELAQGRLVLFAGAGISRFAGMPSWEELVHPLATQLGIDPKDTPLLDIPQYYVTHNAQGRFLLNKHLCESLAVKGGNISIAHRFIKQLPAPIIVTTNFDQLFETTFDTPPTVKYHKIIADEDISYWDKHTKLLIKMNGCISRPASLVIARRDFWDYRQKHPIICDKLKSLMAESTFLFIGFSFRDPVFETLYSEVLHHLRDHRRPFYFLALKSNHYEIEDKRSIGLEVLDLQVADSNNPDEVIKFLEVLKVRSTAALGRSANAGPAASGGSSASASTLLSKGAGPDLLSARLGTALSIQVNDRHIDDIHHYNLIYRQDLLDYQVGDFFSFRRLSGSNQSSMLSSFLIYSESSEQKLTFKQTAVTAFDLKTGDDLIVECDGEPDALRFSHAFRIYFSRPLAPNEDFDIAYCIRLPGELSILSDKNEVMSISFARIRRGVDNLHFNVCLNFKPKSFSVECLDRVNTRVVPAGPPPQLSEYKPSDTLETRFDIKWSSQPFRITWKQEQPDHLLYIINYRR